MVTLRGIRLGSPVPSDFLRRGCSAYGSRVTCQNVRQMTFGLNTGGFFEGTGASDEIEAFRVWVGRGYLSVQVQIIYYSISEYGRFLQAFNSAIPICLICTCDLLPRPLCALRARKGRKTFGGISEFPLSSIVSPCTPLEKIPQLTRLLTSQKLILGLHQ